jgi:acylpyruvate hydrolase
MTIIAYGKNYKGFFASPAEYPPTPFFFIKPETTLTTGDVELPRQSNEVVFECELGIVIGQDCRHVKNDREAVASVISGYVVALDMTALDILKEAMAKGRPWAEAKSFDTFTPISAVIPVSQIKDHNDVPLFLSQNGAVRIDGSTSGMVHNCEALVAHASSIMTLKRGDIILTGTPTGVAPVKDGDKLVWGIKGTDLHTTNIKNAQH